MKKYIEKYKNSSLKLLTFIMLCAKMEEVGEQWGAVWQRVKIQSGVGVRDHFMFLGEYDYKLDDKGRVPVPPKFREEMRDGIVLIPGPDKCIFAYTPFEWEKISENLPAGTIASSKMRKLNRALFSTAFRLNLDGQGRIVLPTPLRHYAGIREEIVITGANTYLEIWDKQSWEEEKANSLAQAWQIIESLEKR